MTDEFAAVFDWNDPALMAVFDEAPLWSAIFGQVLLERVPLAPGLTVLDLACGAGFPLLDLAQRLGRDCRACGLDGWLNGLRRARFKQVALGVKQVALIGGDGAAMPFVAGSFDLIVSNLGINNFSDARGVLRECARVLRPGGRLALTTNLRGHMSEFYAVYADVLQEAGHADLLPALEAHVAGRMTVAAACALLEEAGLIVTDVYEQTFSLRYVDGSALLRHSFIRMAFLEGWREFLPPEEAVAILRRLEAALNRLAAREGELRLTVPLAYLESVKG